MQLSLYVTSGSEIHGHIQRFFLNKQLSVWRAILAWGPLPTDDDNIGFNNVDIFTDGSTVMSRQWPSTPIAASWSVYFLPKVPGQIRFLGALWGAVAIEQMDPLCFGATRPTSPVAELSAIDVALKMLRAVKFRGKIVWG